MVDPQDVEAMIRKMAEARDKALSKILYFKCQHCGEIKLIKEAVGVEDPPGDAAPAAQLDPEGGSSGTTLRSGEELFHGGPVGLSEK